ncbi:Asp23/Gls24 family envelope stress response protein [Streptomyces sp. Ru72]|uniref:Asp23/Gls24 family envelope stress response protein n=1 Tax=Streptomyces sp. Ru72 TaxID=2080747 RepID=UPI000CDE0AB6|nr:Asp23/Gls24 family envelope stress response protein [Streptomyces sp. Ru72]POX51110.1 Asp23/Gls24 family protein [Streptomyces sp. Ru72]
MPLPPPAERGATVIPDRVVARIATRVARTALARRAAPPRGGHPEAVAPPDASAATRGGTTRLHLAVDLPYPTDIPGVSLDIQRDVAERVTELTGLPVTEVTVTVRRLVPKAGFARGRVQ